MANKRKDDTPIEFALPVFIGFMSYSKTSNLKSAFTAFLYSLIIIMAISFVIRHHKKEKYRQKLLASGIDIVDKMTGEEFEKFLLVHFEKLGYKGDTTPKTNDYGADLILDKEGEKIVVQAKRWRSKVGIEAVQQIIGAREYYKASRCIVATNNFFTPNAKNLAIKSNVELWDRKELIEIMSKSNGKEIVKTIATDEDINKEVTCPECGANMTLKKGKYGSFYGCSNFPKCKCTKNIT